MSVARCPGSAPSPHLPFLWPSCTAAMQRPPHVKGWGRERGQGGGNCGNRRGVEGADVRPTDREHGGRCPCGPTLNQASNILRDPPGRLRNQLASSHRLDPQAPRPRASLLAPVSLCLLLYRLGVTGPHVTARGRFERDRQSPGCPLQTGLLFQM